MKVVDGKAGSRLSLTMNSTVAPGLKNPRSPTLLQVTLETYGSFPTYPPDCHHRSKGLVAVGITSRIRPPREVGVGALFQNGME